MRPIDPKDIDRNVFSAIGADWMLVTAGDRNKANTMTASWGGLGVLWGKNVATIYVRPQRYTYEFLERGDYFTLSFLPGEYREALNFCGSRSGREVDKVAHCGLTPAYGQGDAPYFTEAGLALVCRKLYFADIDPAHFLDEELDGKNYPNKDYHRMYIGEIVEALQKG